ncbi:MAG: hypothetical protein LBJ70_01375 [Holosporales bacterium]|jgi:flagellar motility protein MotE (MotC chaperone)|nr:hypothetical protein [Holosporales bacterium]
METRYEEQIKELKSQLSTAEKTSETLRKSFKTCTNDPAELHRIVKIFENMRAKNAAAILELLPGEMQALILRAMRERKAAPVLAQMNPQKASEATETLVDPTAAAAHASLDPSLRIPTTRKEILAQRVVKQKS